VVILNIHFCGCAITPFHMISNHRKSSECAKMYCRCL